MAKARSIDQTLSQLRALRSMGPSSIAPELQKHLSSRTNLVVAKAADLVRETGLKSLQPHLVEAFWRFMQGSATVDKGCDAKQAIVNALYELGCDAPEVFLAGIRHVQMEGSFGRSVDTAAEMRGLSALGLVRMAYRDVMNELVDLLADDSHQARIMACRAIAYAGRDEGALLLRLKILTGDDDDSVTGEALVALGSLGRGKAIPFIRKYLDASNPTLAESAALALGEMRDAAALDLLLEQWERSRLPESRATLVLPIALSRQPRSLEFLLKVLATDAEPVAATAIEALRMYRHDDSARAAIHAAVEGRKVDRLVVQFDKLFNG